MPRVTTAADQRVLRSGATDVRVIVGEATTAPQIPATPTQTFLTSKPVPVPYQ